MGAHIFLISLYTATVASFLVLGVSLMAEVSPMGAAVRAGVAFLAFTVLGLVAKAAAGDANGSDAEQRGQNFDVMLPATDAGAHGRSGAQAGSGKGRRERGRAAA